MRIIGGNLRGRKLVPLKGMAIRPTSDRVREALFNILGPKTVDGVVLDLYSGSGALGLEAISRGAREVLFLDKSTASLRVAEKNIKLCRAEHQCKTIRWDILKNLNCLNSHPGHFNLIFLDPPYNREMVSRTLLHLASCPAVAADATVVAEHAPDEPALCPSAQWDLSDSRRYGQTQLSFFHVTSPV